MQSYLNKHLEHSRMVRMIMPHYNITLPDFLLQKFENYIDDDNPHKCILNETTITVNVTDTDMVSVLKRVDLDNTIHVHTSNEQPYRLDSKYFRLYVSDAELETVDNFNTFISDMGLLVTNLIVQHTDIYDNVDYYPVAFITKRCDKCGNVTRLCNTLDECTHFCFNCSTLTYDIDRSLPITTHLNGIITNDVSALSYNMDDINKLIYTDTNIRESHCVYICPSCRTVYTNTIDRSCVICENENILGIRDEDNKQLISVDTAIIPTLELLWDNSIKTKYCCAGFHENHFFQGTVVSDLDTYIMLSLYRVLLPHNNNSELSMIHNTHNWFICNHPCVNYEIQNSMDGDFVLVVRSCEGIDKLHSFVIDLCNHNKSQKQQINE